MQVEPKHGRFILQFVLMSPQSKCFVVLKAKARDLFQVVELAVSPRIFLGKAEDSRLALAV